MIYLLSNGDYKMQKIIILFIFPFLSFSQLFTIDTDYMEIYNLSSVNNFSENTYVNTLGDINMSYEIIVDSMPASWDFQHCFPECHPINTYQSLLLSPLILVFF